MRKPSERHECGCAEHKREAAAAIQQAIIETATAEIIVVTPISEGVNADLPGEWAAQDYAI